MYHAAMKTKLNDAQCKSEEFSDVPYPNTYMLQTVVDYFTQALEWRLYDRRKPSSAFQIKGTHAQIARTHPTCHPTIEYICPLELRKR